MILVRAFVETPVGVMRALATETALCAFEFFSPGRMARLDARLARWFPDLEFEDRENRVLERTRAWASEYFSGQLPSFNLPLDMRGAAFERRVWQELTAIPPGTTTSYGAIAKGLGTPGASRAVGMANGANPVAIIVPCHRVIGANGKLTGYGGGLHRKTWLLEHERRWAPRDDSRLDFA